MVCDITKGRKKPCKKHTGGVNKLYLFNFLENPFTLTGGQATAINAALTTVYEYDLVGDGQVLAENMVGDESAGTRVNTQTITAILQGLDDVTSNEMKLIVAGKPQAVVKTKDGAYLLVGDTYGINFNVDATTGTTNGEFSGYTLTGVSLENKLAPHLDTITITSFLSLVVPNP